MSNGANLPTLGSRDIPRSSLVRRNASPNLANELGTPSTDSDSGGWSSSSDDGHLFDEQDEIIKRAAKRKRKAALQLSFDDEEIDVRPKRLKLDDGPDDGGHTATVPDPFAEQLAVVKVFEDRFPDLHYNPKANLLQRELDSYAISYRRRSLPVSPSAPGKICSAELRHALAQNGIIVLVSIVGTELHVSFAESFLLEENWNLTCPLATSLKDYLATLKGECFRSATIVLSKLHRIPLKTPNYTMVNNYTRSISLASKLITLIRQWRKESHQSSKKICQNKCNPRDA